MNKTLIILAGLLWMGAGSAEALDVSGASHAVARSGTDLTVSGSFAFSGSETFTVVYSLPAGWTYVNGSGSASSGTPVFAYNAGGNELACFFFGTPTSPFSYSFHVTCPSVDAAGVISGRVEYTDELGYPQSPFTIGDELRFPIYTLTVASGHGVSDPVPGAYQYVGGASVACTVASPDTQGATQYVCTGWAGTGSVPASGATTNVSFTLTNDSSIVWNWSTNYWLAVETTGNGGVDVASGWVAAGSNATVTATPDENWHFAGWSGDTNGCVIAGSVITAPMTRSRALTASFAIDTKTLTVVSDHGGAQPGTITADWGMLVSQWVTNSPVVNGATQYVCTAGAVAGNAFTLASPTNVTLTLTNNATLTWQWQTQHLLVTATNGSGTVTAGGWWNSGSNATVTATPAANWHFAGWAGDTNGCALAGNMLTAPMTQARAVTAVFALDTMILTVASEHGVPDPAVGTYTNAWGTGLFLTMASPDTQGATQYVCTGWAGTGSVPAGGVTANVSCTLTNDSGIVWNWATNYWLAVATAGNGGVDATAGWIAAGSNATVTATPDENWHFAGWTGDTNGCVLAGNVITAPMTQARSVTAIFEIDQKTLTVVSAQGGASPGTVTAEWGTAVSQFVTNSPVVNGATQYVCMAGAVAGNAFTLASPTNVTLTLTNDATLTWQWQTQYRLATGTNGCGTVTAGGWWNAGSNATVTAIAAANWHFAGWAGDTNDCVIAGSVLTAPMTLARAVTAVFAIDTKLLTVASEHGVPDPAVGTHTNAWGTGLFLTVASPDTQGATQYVCTGWAGTGSVPSAGGTTNVSFTITNDSGLVWNWATNYWLAVATAGNGGVDTADGWIAAGSNATVTATPAANWHFAGWSGDTNGCVLAGSVITAPMTQARVLTASFAIDTYAVTFDLGAHGTRSGGGELSQTIAHGAAATAPEVQPEAGWTFEGWDAAFGNVTGPLTVHAQYAQILYTLTVASEHGVPDPAVGTYTNAWGTGLFLTMASPDTQGATQYVCTGWAGTGSVPASGSTTNVSCTLTNDSGIVWNWATNYWLAGATAGNGSVDATDGWIAAGSNATVTATPAANWHFAGWSGDTNGCTLAGSVITAPMTQPRALTASFAIDTKTLTVTSEHGVADPAVGTYTNAWGTGLFLTMASPDTQGATQYVCTGWAGTGSVPASGATTNVSFTLTNDSGIVWGWSTNYWLAVATAGGSGDTSVTSAWYAAGTEATVEAFAADGYRLDHWLVDGARPPAGGSVSTGNWVRVPMGEPHMVTAVFVVLDLPEALDNWALAWTTGGNTNWFAQCAETQDGVDAASSGGIGDRERCWLETSVTNSGLLTFWWRVSSEQDYDWLRFRIDGKVWQAITGEAEWTRVTIRVEGDGAHALRWEYAKDKSLAEGHDRGWVDQAVWTPDAAPLTGFALWADQAGLAGDAAALFGQDRNGDGVPNAFEYAFGANLQTDELLLDIRLVDGQPVVDIPAQDASTAPYVDVHLVASTNLVDWVLPVVPAADTTGKPANRAWFQTEDTPPEKAFFKLEAELK